MRSVESLSHWVEQLLPGTCCAQQAAAELLRALLLGFTVELAQLARQLQRAGTAKSRRQYLERWLEHPPWEPERIYTRLNRLTRRLVHQLARRGEVLLLVDASDLADGWLMLQVSVPWQGRALPLYRAVTQYAGPEETLPELVGRALRWLGRHLPGPRRRYVLVMDRGFPSQPLVRRLQEEGWRFVLRVKGNWKLQHPEYTGPVRGLVAAGLCGPVARLLPGGVLGQAGRSGRSSHASLVSYHGPEHAEPWFLVTSEREAARVVALYRQRMQIEQEFRDLKGPLGLDHLATWRDLDRVARLLAWIAVYEWRLAYLWLVHRLAAFARELRVAGPLSWVRTVREWLLHHSRSAVPLTDLRL
jgi:hypothetical protein